MAAMLRRVLGEGFRVFFLSAGLYGLFAGLVWVLWLAAQAAGLAAGDPSYAMSPPMWHAHEMIFGYSAAALGGFFLTAVPNWTGAPNARYVFVAATAGLWLAGRLAMWFSAYLAPWMVAALDLVFIPVLAAKIASQLLRRPKPQNMIFLLLLAYVWVSNLMTHLQWLSLTDDTVNIGLRGGLLALCAMIAVLGGRITPAFTRNAMKRAGQPEATWPISVPVLEKASLIVALSLPAVFLVLGTGRLTGVLALVLGGLQLLRLSRWRAGWALQQPILIALHLGLAMLALGLILWGAALLGFGSEVGALHVLGIGCVGCMTLAVMSRAALGHSGRALVAPSPMALAYGLMAAAAVTRWLATLLPDSIYMSLMLVAAALWTIATALFVLSMWTALTAPRVA